MLKSACRWRPMSSWLLAWITWALPAAPGQSTTEAELWTWVLSRGGAEMGVLRIELWPFHIEECGGPPGLVLRQPLPWGPRFRPVPNRHRCPTAPNHSFLGSPNPDQHLRGRQTLAMMPPGPSSSCALSFPLFSTRPLKVVYPLRPHALLLPLTPGAVWMDGCQGPTNRPLCSTRVKGIRTVCGVRQGPAKGRTGSGEVCVLERALF